MQAGPVTRRLRESEEFFMKRDKVHTTLERLVHRLDREGIDYAIIGGMALNIHGYNRVTQDVDLLLSEVGLEQFKRKCVGLGYVPSFPDAQKSYLDAESRVPIEIVTTGQYPGDGKPKPVVFPEPASSSEEIEGLRVIKLEKLIELKLASGLTASHRLRDLADVQDLIVLLKLPRELSNSLDTSVGAKYVELWDSAQEAFSSE
jgi:hypothetical protein